MQSRSIFRADASFSRSLGSDIGFFPFKFTILTYAGKGFLSTSVSFFIFLVGKYQPTLINLFFYLSFKSSAFANYVAPRVVPLVVLSQSELLVSRDCLTLLEFDPFIFIQSIKYLIGLRDVEGICISRCPSFEFSGLSRLRYLTFMRLTVLDHLSRTNFSFISRNLAVARTTRLILSRPFFYK